MVAVVTGASGHVGAALVRALMEQGKQVRALVRTDTRAIDGLDLDVRRVDVRDVASLEGAFEGASVVYHAAARVSLESVVDPDADAVNLAGTRNVLAACRKRGVGRLVHFSTIHALGRGDQALIAADAGLPYERSKANAERDVMEAAAGDVDAVVVSPCAVVGPFDHKPSYMGRVLIMLSRGLLPAVVHGGQSWVDVRDVAAAAIAAGDAGVRGRRYVVAGHWLSMFELTKLASQIAGVSPPRLQIPTRYVRPFAPLAERTFRLLKQEPLLSRASLDALEAEPRTASETHARDDLNHVPRPTASTLEDTYRWFVDRGLVARRTKKGFFS